MSKTESKLVAWKEKAKERRIKIWVLEKRNKEVILGREKLREKYKQSQEEIRLLQKQLCGKNNSLPTKIKHHSYSAEEIQFFVNLRTLGGCSYRGCLRVLTVMRLVLTLDFSMPSPSSIRNWEIKLGLEKIQQQCPETDTDWVLIFDESVSVGSQKILLLIGVNLQNYKFGKPLTMADIDVLDLRINKSWKAEEIKSVVATVFNRKYRFRYCCSDNGNNLRKALKLNDIVHIEDCGHCLGKLLEKRYKNDTQYKAFSAKKSLFKKQNLLSKYAEFLPPQQRSKGRFMNLWTSCEWANNVLKVVEKHEKENIGSEAFEKIKWIIDYRDLIPKLYAEQALINQINKILKMEGLSSESIEKCEEKIEESTIDKEFSAQIRDYLNRNLLKLLEEDVILCSSDIIEAIFGKLKNSLGDNTMSGLTEGSLAVANYGKKVSISTIKRVMEKMKIVDIEEWRKNNLPISVQQKRIKLFKNTG